MKSAVFIVDDDAGLRESMTLLLSSSGYRVEEYASGEDLLTRGDASSAFCLVLDVNLSGESGLKVLERLRDSRVEVPAIVVTGRMSKTVRREGKRLGAAAVFEKPVAAKDLLAAISAAGV